jgi:hypothetical protein
MGYDQYKVKVDGTGRITLRNRRFLRLIKPYKDLLLEQRGPKLSSNGAEIR